MIKLDKELLDAFIECSHKCINTDDITTYVMDEYDEIQMKLFNDIHLSSLEVSDIIWSLCNLEMSNEDIYAVLNVLGFEVI